MPLLDTLNTLQELKLWVNIKSDLQIIILLNSIRNIKQRSMAPWILEKLEIYQSAPSLNRVYDETRCFSWGKPLVFKLDVVYNIAGKIILESLPNKVFRCWSFQFWQQGYWVSDLSLTANLSSRVYNLMGTFCISNKYKQEQ